MKIKEMKEREKLCYQRKRILLYLETSMEEPIAMILKRGYGIVLQVMK
jgi:hypothetical protein